MLTVTHSICPQQFCCHRLSLAPLGRKRNLRASNPSRGMSLIRNSSKEEREDSIEVQPRYEKDLEEDHQNADSMYVVDKILRHVGYGPRLK